MTILDDIKSIAVIDDEQTALEASVYDVEAMGRSAYALRGSYTSPGDILAEIRGKAEAVLCDHRLGHGGSANFDGASLAAFLYSNKIPAVLMTQYYEIDRDVSIRRWRRNIPSLISKKDITSDTLRESFDFCCQELSGAVVPGRRAYAALFEILERTSESGEDVVDITLPAWNSKQAIRIPLSLFTDLPKDKIVPGVWLTANVNIGAEKDEELFLTKFPLLRPLIRMMALPKLIILDVGHGSAAALIDGVDCCIFDGGRGTTLSEFLESQKIGTIKAVFVSHADDDHVAGITTLLLDESISIQVLFVNPAQKKDTKAWDAFRIALSMAKKRGTRLVPALHSKMEEQNLCGGVEIKVIAPSAELILGGSGLDGKKLTFNSSSVVLGLCQSDVYSAIIAGDLDDRGFEDLKGNCAPFGCEVLVYPHYGGATANGKTKEFAADLMTFFSPKAVVFSIGRGVEATPRPEIVDQIRSSSPSVRIVCTQLSEHCAPEVPKVAPAHISELPSKGKKARQCCGGTLVFELNGSRTLNSHILSTHDIFVASLKQPLCKRKL